MQTLHCRGLCAQGCCVHLLHVSCALPFWPYLAIVPREFVGADGGSKGAAEMPGPDSLLHSAQCLHTCFNNPQNYRHLRTAPRSACLTQTVRSARAWGCNSRQRCRVGKALYAVPGGCLSLCKALHWSLSGIGTVRASADLWTPDQHLHLPDVHAAAAPAVVSPGSGYEDHKPRTPPPDLPSLLLDSRITYLGMPVSVLASRVIGSPA